MIILLFGQPASGKTTLSNELKSKIYSSSLVQIDGDEWREVTKNKDYSKEGRLLNLKGAFDMAIYLEKKGFQIILSFVTPFEELRSYLAENGQEVAQIYLTYSGDRGRNMNFAKEFEEPTGDYLKIDTSTSTINECVSKIMNYVAKKSAC
jgi:adenylylsulfate kinase